MKLDDDTLSSRIEKRMQSMLGRVSVEPGRQSFPLTASTPRRFAQNRVALVGEAAHIFPPIGAQGLNLEFGMSAISLKSQLNIAKTRLPHRTRGLRCQAATRHSGV
jgi:hypothetical protein